MAQVGKQYRAAAEKVERRPHDLAEALAQVRAVAFAKFDETVEMHIRLGVNPKHSDQMVRGTVMLPHGTGKTKRVVVIAAGEKIAEAEAAGADRAGGQEVIDEIKKGWFDFEAVVATPDMMKDVGKLGKLLGPKGLMPSPKAGTVTFDVAKAVENIKAGQLEFKVDKTAVIHSPVGKLSFSDAQLMENSQTLLRAVLAAKPAAAKGTYLGKIALSTTMGPGIRVDPASVERAA